MRASGNNAAGLAPGAGNAVGSGSGIVIGIGGGGGGNAIGATTAAGIAGSTGSISGTLGTNNNHGMGRITGSASIETLVRVGIEKEHGLSPDSKMVVLHDFTPCVDDELEVKRGQCVNVLYRENDWVYVIGQDSRQEGFIPHSYCAPYNTQLADLAIKKKLPRGVGQGDLHAPAATIAAVGTTPTAAASAATATTTTTTTTADVQEVCMLQLMPELSGDVMMSGDAGGGDVVKGCGAGSAVGMSGGLIAGGGLESSQTSLTSEPDYLPFAKDPSGRYIVLYTFIARDENDVSVERGEFVTGK